jgi:hypothetical protein
MNQHDVVELTREQRAARCKAIQQANAVALREHFTGDDVRARILCFGREASLALAGWTGCFASVHGAVIGS